MRSHIVTNHLRKHCLCASLAAAGLLMSSPVPAGQLVYIPVNPVFGGNPLNGSYMLQSAQAQKSYPYPIDDLGLNEDTDFKILNGGNYPIIQVGNKAYIYDPAKGQWIAFDPNTVSADTPSTASTTSATGSPSASASSASSIDSGVLQ
ncbi:MAG: curli assembly protein CsgF [Castellaniella sp.]|uniref:curli assembly protein CsgF n=1 Tax=Castellaniella sp. TaxID=1955812 RepID=UPI003A851CF5